MAHAHSIYDTDKRFSIDPATREIVNESGKTVLSQHDHNSERFTFEIPKEIDGHDMSACNRVQIHYLNIEASKDALTYEGLYEVEDLQLNPENSETVICSWLISGNATQYVGNLLFAIHFACVADDGTVDYSWGTGIHSSVSIGKTIYNSEVIALEYADVLEKWRVETFAMVEDTLADFSASGIGDKSVTPSKLDRPYSSIGARQYLSANTDLNDITAIGCYSCNSSSTTASFANCPVSTGVFTLDVKHSYGGTRTEKPDSGAYYIHQILMDVHGTEWVRRGVQDSSTLTWHEWVKRLDGRSVFEWTFTVKAADWTQNTDYAQRIVSLTDILTTDILIADVNMPQTANVATQEGYLDAWASVGKVQCITNGQIRLTVFGTAPTSDLPVKVLGLRKS